MSLVLPESNGCLSEGVEAETHTATTLESQDTMSGNNEIKNPVSLTTAGLQNRSTMSERQQAENQTLVEFHLFPRLPAELRLKVWKFAKPGPRIVKIRIAGQDEDSAHIYKNTAPPPAPLFVCQESRIEYLKWFRQLVTTESLEEVREYTEYNLSEPAVWFEDRATTQIKLLEERHRPSAIYFNPTCDTFDVPAVCLFSFLNTDNYFKLSGVSWSDFPAFERRGIRKLRFDVTQMSKSNRDMHFYTLIAGIPYLFQDVETVTLFIVEGQPSIIEQAWQKIGYLLQVLNEVLRKREMQEYQEVPYDKHGNAIAADSSVNREGGIKVVFDWA